MYIIKRATFSASHRLHSPHLSDYNNKTVYGKCNLLNGHGHNYVLKVTVKGKQCNNTGMVINMTILKRIIDTYVLDIIDHRNLDKDIPFFLLNPSTVENLCIYVWNQLSDGFIKENIIDCKLHKIKIKETENNYAIYKGPI